MIGVGKRRSEVTTASDSILKVPPDEEVSSGLAQTLILKFPLGSIETKKLLLKYYPLPPQLLRKNMLLVRNRRQLTKIHDEQPRKL